LDRDSGGENTSSPERAKFPSDAEAKCVCGMPENGSSEGGVGSWLGCSWWDAFGRREAASEESAEESEQGSTHGGETTMVGCCSEDDDVGMGMVLWMWRWWCGAPSVRAMRYAATSRE